MRPTDFDQTYLGKLRKHVGSELLMATGTQIVIENEKGEVLLQLRTDFQRWGLPGGSAEPGESIQACTCREAKEETGLTVGKITPFGFSSTPELELITFPNGDQCHYFNLLVTVKEFTGTLLLANEESAELKWFDPSTPPDLLPNFKSTLEAWKTFNKTGVFQLT